MHRFDEQFLLKEAQRKMRGYEERAALHHALGDLKRSQPSLRQRVAHALIALGRRLETERDSASQPQEPWSKSEMQPTCGISR